MDFGATDSPELDSAWYAAHPMPRSPQHHQSVTAEDLTGGAAADRAAYAAFN
jgi:hypothetical protein